MGLDTVELVLEVEDTFAITISDDEAAGMLTAWPFPSLVGARENR